MGYFVVVQYVEFDGYIKSIDSFSDLNSAINYAEELLIDYNSCESSYFYSYPYSKDFLRCSVIIGDFTDAAEPIFRISLIKE